VTDSLVGVASCADSDLARDAVTDCTVSSYTIPGADARTTMTNTALATGLHPGAVEVAALQLSSNLRVSNPPHARLALIIMATLIAVGGLFVIAGRRGRRVR
jgi:hypothetical protein